VPAEASEGERNFVFVSRKYIAVCQPVPDSIKNVPISVMQDKVKTDSPGAPAPAPVAAPVILGQRTIISDQAAFSEWFSKLAGPTGQSRVVKVIAALIDREGGVTPNIAEHNPMRDHCVNMIAPPVNCADAFTKPSVNMVTPRPHPRGSPFRDSRSACPDVHSPLSTGYGPGAPVFAPPQHTTPPPPSVAAPLLSLGWMTAPRAARDAIVAKISRSNSDERKSALLALMLVWIAGCSSFSSPAASMLADRRARVRATLLRIALRVVRALGVGAVRVTMVASAAEPQLIGALV
jgi:hypothetical protein